MKGLVKKDLFIIRNNFKLFFLLPISFALLPGLQNTDFLMTIISLLISFLLSTQLLTTLSSDESFGWKKVSFSMPVSIKKIILSKYLTGVLLALFSFVLVFILGFLFNIFFHFSNDYKIIFFWSLVSVFIGFTLIIFSIPLSYKYGVENSKYFFLGAVALPVIGSYILNYFNIKINDLIIFFSNMNLMIFYILFISFLFLSFFISIVISQKIYLDSK